MKNLSKVSRREFATIGCGGTESWRVPKGLLALDQKEAGG